MLRSGAQVSSPAGIDALASLLKNQAEGMAATAGGAPVNGDETAFAAQTAQMKSLLANQSASPEYAMSQALSLAMFQNHIRRQPPSAGFHVSLK